jgi:hypothetical protein
MTAEIAILNKNAVALAADSAVTIQKPGTQKIYNTANKLFMLSKYHPVGIMVYGTAELMGFPWETVIKIYREDLGTSNFKRLIEFAEHFIVFLENNRSLFTDRLQTSSLEAMCHWILSQLRETIDGKVKQEIASRGEVSDTEIGRIVGEVLDEACNNWAAYKRLECFPEKFENELIEKYRANLDQLIDQIFGKLPIEGVREKVLQICAFRVTREWWSVSSGGIVVAGFGKDDVLPVVQSYMVESIVHNRLKHDPQPFLSNDMNESGIAMIIPFAQAEIVHRFIRGIDPDYKVEFTQFLRTLLSNEYPAKLLQQFEERLNEEDKRNTQAELIRLGRAVVSEFETKWSDWERNKFIDPVLQIVGDLPKDELAAMAESLVNLTSFKRKITAEAETVGGPIDVAVISKGDGFIWIKRKHYFQPELNPAFFANYYRRREA